MSPSAVAGPPPTLPDFGASDFKTHALQSTVPAITNTNKTLLLCPPSLSSHPDTLNAIVAQYDRSATDIQMVDRLAAGVITLPPSSYQTIIVLPGPDGTNSESTKLFVNRTVLRQLAQALAPGAILRHTNGGFDKSERTEGILEGLAEGADGVLMKPEDTEVVSVPLRLGKRKTAAGVGPGAVPTNGTNGSNGADSAPSAKSTAPSGVGFVDFSDDLDVDPEDDDDELIDEDTLLDESDLARPIIQRKWPSQASILTLLTRPSCRVPSQARQAAPRLQRLFLWSRSAPRSRRRRKA